MTTGPGYQQQYPPQWQQPWQAPPPPPPPPKRRTGLWVTLGVVSLVLVVAVGAGVGLVIRSQRAGQQQAVGATPSGEPGTVVVTDQEIAQLVAGHSKALASGDVKAFTSIFDQKNAALVRQQTRVFTNLRKVPLAEVSYKTLQREGRAEDSFGRGVTFTQDIAFVHKFAGIDLRPVSEWYRWTLRKASANAPLVVTKVGGAPPPISDDEGSKTMYYPGPWDIWPDIAVVKAGASLVLARPQDAALARRVAPTVSRAARSALGYWQANGDSSAPVPSGFLVALTAGKAQLGGLFRQSKATEEGVTIPMPTWGGGGDPVKVGGSRIVLDTRSPFFATQAGILEVSTHEIAHALVAGLDSADFSLFGKANWIVEGFAEYVANRGRPITSNLRYQEGRAYLAGQLAVPFRGELPTNALWDFKGMVSINYLMGHLAMRHIAQEYGEEKLAAGVLAAYSAPGDSSEAALFKTLGTTKAAFERQWASYVREQLG
ncbi:hypothetical protein [Nonomuraea pusilla]|uniref:Peptidase MA superfamily n=1 Tax=Nonomuraea pusilla TaxID=46177 RepID=A0A1H8BMN4_9ACTN|nr:hypothetical protein [Nonomuraea pusilla]SEM84161.1 hypothetical protein SAMN05660976_06137 [Nonomuraea pusilla]